METLNTWFTENERAVKRCLASQDINYGFLYETMMPEYKAMEDDLSDGRLENYPVLIVEGSASQLSKTALDVFMQCGIR